MHARVKLSAAVLGTLLFTVAPAITLAETQQEWFLKQLQATDGYIPEASTPTSKKNDGDTVRTDTGSTKSADRDTGYIGASMEGRNASLPIGNHENDYDPFSPFGSDFEYSAP